MMGNKLQIIWNNVRHIKGYQHILSLLDFSYKELDIIDELENTEIAIIAKEKKYYDEIEMPKIKQQDREFVKEMMENEEVKNIRIEYIEKRKEKLESLIKKANQHNEEMKLKFVNPFVSLGWLRISIMDLWELSMLEKKLKKIMFEYRLLKYKGEIKQGAINEFMIAKAREYPFELLIEANKRHFAICPFHNEKTPSFYIKKNFGYCFSCGKSCDTIGLLMERDNISFIEAVKQLQ